MLNRLVLKYPASLVIPPYAQSRHYYIAYGYCASRREYYAFIYFTPISAFALMEDTISLSLIILSYPDDNALSSVVSSKYSSIAISSSLTPSVSLPLVYKIEDYFSVIYLFVRIALIHSAYFVAVFSLTAHIKACYYYHTQDT